MSTPREKRAVMCIMLWAFLPLHAYDCLSPRCCNSTEIEVAGHQLTSTVQVPKHMPSSKGCKVSTEGHISERSISPWRYEKDEDNTRFPARLWQAHCNCPRCLALKPSLTAGKHRDEINHEGNSVIVNYTTIVFFRKQCETDPHRYKLEPALYSVNVSCTCVVREKARRGT